MTSTVDGLVSGLDTTNLINQLMQVEAIPQSKIKAKVTAQEKATVAFQAVNSKLSTLQTAAEALTKTETWQPVKATSSSSAVTATATAGAATGSTTFNITQLARQQVSTVALPDSGTVLDGTGLKITVGSGDPVDITVTTDTAQGVADAINKAGIGVKAAVITTENGDLRLQLSSAKTGTDNAFTVSGLVNSATTLSAAQNARITVGNPDTTGYAVTSQSNTFTSLMQGVTFTATKVENDVTVSVATDTSAIADKMKALIDAANSTLSDISAKSAYNSASKTAEPLNGNFLVRSLASNISSAVSAGLKVEDPDTQEVTYSSFKAVGVELNKDGTLKFDREAFLAALNEDPKKVTEVSTGLATALQTVAKTGSSDITAVITTGDNTVKELNKQIESWDRRLELRRTSLQKTYSALEVALSKMQQQSSWLAGQLATLPSYSSGD